MTSIPYDPSLVLGNLVNKEKIKALQVRAEIQNPVDVAAEKLRNLTRQLYKIENLYQSMLSKIDVINLAKLFAQKLLSRKMVARASIEYAQKFLVAQDALYAHELASQGLEPLQVESPCDFSQCRPQPYSLSFDSLKFDVQYFRNEGNTETSAATSISRYVNETKNSNIPSIGNSNLDVSENVSASLSASFSRHTIEGTLVIIAHCTHKQALMIDPFVFDAQKAVRAWKATFAEEFPTDPLTMFTLASVPTLPFQKRLHMLSGCSLASSFVGFVHILQEETSSAVTASQGEAVARSVKTEMEIAAMKGDMGVSSSFAESAKGLLSNSRLNNHCALVCRGVIPSIKCNTLTTSVSKMQIDPQTTMKALAKIKDGKDATNSTLETSAGDAKLGRNFLEVSTGHVEGTVASVGKVQDANNKVIDTNSMFEAFSDYVTKAASGEAGVPINFYIKTLRRADIAKKYISEFYPNLGEMKIMEKEN